LEGTLLQGLANGGVEHKGECLNDRLSVAKNALNVKKAEGKGGVKAPYKLLPHVSGFVCE